MGGQIATPGDRRAARVEAEESGPEQGWGAGEAGLNAEPERGTQGGRGTQPQPLAAPQSSMWTVDDF